MLIEKMKSINNLTTQEKYIVDYILKNPKVIFNTTAEDLAKLTYTSSSTIVRLCKKLGSKGYPDFRLKYVVEYRNEELLKKELFTKPFNENGDLIDIAYAITHIYERVINETHEMLNKSSLTNIISLMKSAKRIDIYGVEINYYIAQQACCKFNDLGINAMAFNGANLQYISLSELHSNTVAFIISHTGKNTAMIEAAKVLKNNNITAIAICGSDDTALSKLCNETIAIYSRNEISYLSKVTYTLSTQYVFDILFSTLAIDKISKK